MLHIKLKGMEYRAPRKHIYCPSAPGARSKGENFLFSESSHVAYQREWSVEHHASIYLFFYSVHKYTLDPWVRSKGQNFFFLNVVMLHIKLKGKTYRPT